MSFRFCLLPVVIWLAACTGERQPDLREHDIESLQSAMQEGSISSEELVAYYLAEIARIDAAGPELRAIIEINPDALDIASALDRERQLSGPRGPLHGIPVVLKANIDTGDNMATSAGSLALADNIAPDDAFLVARLREAGAVILAKTNLSEWANFRSSRSTSGWSSLGGQTRNPYDPRRNPCGSSSGSAVAVAANLAAVAVGTETWGSIVCPAGINGIVGIKPTLGLVSRDGIIPISHSQDTAGPMARTVRDAAILLTALAARDASDPATGGRPEGAVDYAANLATDALKGKRIGVLRNYSDAGKDPHAEAVFAQALRTLENAGAELVDPVELDFSAVWDAEGEVLYYEFKSGLNAYLHGSNSTLMTLEELIRFNSENASTVMPFFGQEEFLTAQTKGPLTDAAYLDALRIAKGESQRVIDEALATSGLDAIVAPTNSPAWLTDHVHGDTSFGVSSSAYAAISGYAGITVPAGFAAGLPVGLSFISGPFTERALIEMAYAFEQASKARRAPDSQ